MCRGDLIVVLEVLLHLYSTPKDHTSMVKLEMHHFAFGTNLKMSYTQDHQLI